jgi:hypothetical protein
MATGMAGGLGEGTGYVTVEAAWPAVPSRLRGPDEVVDQLQADLRERAEVTGSGAGGMSVLVYHGAEVESLADDLLEKLAFLRFPLGTQVTWSDDRGSHVRTLDAPVHPDIDSPAVPGTAG